MNDTALTYVETLERLQAGEPISTISTEDLAVAATGVRLDVEDRLGRLNRFANAREALEYAGELPGHQRERLVRIVSVREERGASLSAEHEAVMALNAAQMLKVMKAELVRRNPVTN